MSGLEAAPMLPVDIESEAAAPAVAPATRVSRSVRVGVAVLLATAAVVALARGTGAATASTSSSLAENGPTTAGGAETGTLAGSDEAWSWSCWFWCSKSTSSESDDAVSQCSACSGLSDKACLTLLDKTVDNMSDMDRMSFERGALDPVGDAVSGCPSWSCLSALDDLAAGMSDKERLSTWTSECAEGTLTVTAADYDDLA